MTEQQDSEWVKSATDDATLVAELLMRLKNTEPTEPPEKTMTVEVEDAAPLKWGVRLPRSRQSIVKTECKPPRASPTTPLSWSGGSGGGDYHEASSRRPRSKVTSPSEATNKRSRKKKTFAELKETENLLLNERIRLKKELACLHTNYRKQMNLNKSLKRKELESQIQSAKRTCGTDAAKEIVFDRPCQAEVAHDLDVAVLPTFQPSISHEVQEQKMPFPSFVLPDLNLPLDEHSVSEDLYGMS